MTIWPQQAMIRCGASAASRARPPGERRSTERHARTRPRRHRVEAERGGDVRGSADAQSWPLGLALRERFRSAAASAATSPSANRRSRSRRRESDRARSRTASLTTHGNPVGERFVDDQSPCFGHVARQHQAVGDRIRSAEFALVQEAVIFRSTPSRVGLGAHVGFERARSRRPARDAAAERARPRDEIERPLRFAPACRRTAGRTRPARCPSRRRARLRASGAWYRAARRGKHVVVDAVRHVGRSDSRARRTCVRYSSARLPGAEKPVELPQQQPGLDASTARRLQPAGPLSRCESPR